MPDRIDVLVREDELERVLVEEDESLLECLLEAVGVTLDDAVQEVVVEPVEVFVTSPGVFVIGADIVPVFDDDTLRVSLDVDDVVRDSRGEAELVGLPFRVPVP